MANQDVWGPDTKSQVIVEYDNGKAVAIHSILVSTMHQCSLECVREGVELAIRYNLVGLDEDVYENFIKGKDVKIDVNPCGSWQIGGPVSDCGITGRKLVVDSYGGYCNIGGGNYSGKDFSKVDRSGAYMARYLAKNIVASGFCDFCRVTLSYMIGVAQPCSVEIDVNRNENKVPQIKKWIADNIDLTPKGIIDRFTQNVFPFYYQTSRDGHFGFNEEIPSLFRREWERLDIASELEKFA